MRQLNHGGDHHLNKVSVDLPRRIPEEAGDAVASVVHQGVDLDVTVLHFIEDRSGRVGLCEVRRNDGCLHIVLAGDLVCELREAVFSPRGQYQVKAVCREDSGELFSDSRGGSGDEGRSAATSFAHARSIAVRLELARVVCGFFKFVVGARQWGAARRQGRSLSGRLVREFD